MRVFMVGFMVVAGCATTPADDPKDEIEAWPCASIARVDDVAASSTRYAYDDLHNIVWQQQTSLAGSNAGTVISTLTKTYQGKIAVTEDDIAPDFHEWTERKVVGDRIMTETSTIYPHSPTTSIWTYGDNRVVRIDRHDENPGSPKWYSLFSYPDANTRVERACMVVDGSESCSTETRFGGVETYTMLRNVTADGTSTYEETRTLDANGLPTLIEGGYLRADGTRSVVTHIEIERRADGAPLFMDDGRAQTTYQFSCD